MKQKRNIRIFPPEEMIECAVTLPLSKSMSARALIINKIGGFNTDIEVSDSDDTAALSSGLDVLEGKVNVGPAGTAMRFLTAYYAATPGASIVLDGDERMRDRPIGILVDALRDMGADIKYLGNEGFPPLEIHGHVLSGGEINLDATVSSQYISALMMIAPKLAKPLILNFDGEPTSLPYIRMTSAMMTRAGVEPDFLYNRIEIPNRPYTFPIGEIESDWSAASYWYAISAISAGWITLRNMGLNSVQGDSAMIKFGEKIGVTTSVSDEERNALQLSVTPEQFSRLDADMADTPDLVQTLAIAAAALGMPFRFTGVHTLRNKETDRLKALKDEALKLGLIFETEGDDILAWEGKSMPIHELPRFNTYNDHRMAMALAPVSIVLPGIIIEDADVVSKSYPQFWNDLTHAGFIIQEVGDGTETAE